MRNAVISFAGLAVLAGAALLACSAADPGVGDYGPRPHGTAVGQPASSGPGVVDSGTSSGGNHDSGSSSGGTDSGSGGGTDSGGGDSATQQTSPFTGLAAYASKPVATSARATHAAQNPPQAAQQPNTDCLACHVTGGLAVPFLAAGFVTDTVGGQVGAADIEVGVYAAGAGAAFSAHTDADGFYWINPPAAGATGPYYPGVRNATTEKDMPTQPANLDCNSGACHGGQPIHIP